MENTASARKRLLETMFTEQKQILRCDRKHKETLSLRSIKTNNRSVDNFKKILLNELYTWARDTVMWHWSVDALFDSWS